MEVDPKHYSKAVKTTIILCKDIGSIALLKNLLKESYHFIDVRHDIWLFNEMEKRSIDLIIVDEASLDLPFDEFCKKVRRNVTDKPIPIILITANIKEDFQKEARAKGISSFINKRLYHEDIKRSIDQAFAQERARAKVKLISHRLEDIGKTAYQDLLSCSKTFEQIRKSRKESTALSMLFLELTRLDELIAVWGKQLLPAIEKFLKGLVGKEQTVNQESDSLYTLVLPNITEREAEELIKKLKKHIEKTPVKLGMANIFLHFNISYQTFYEDEGSIDNLDAFVAKAAKALPKKEP